MKCWKASEWNIPGKKLCLGKYLAIWDAINFLSMFPSTKPHSALQHGFRVEEHKYKTGISAIQSWADLWHTAKCKIRHFTQRTVAVFLKTTCYFLSKIQTKIFFFWPSWHYIILTEHMKRRCIEIKSRWDFNSSQSQQSLISRARKTIRLG